MIKHTFKITKDCLMLRVKLFLFFYILFVALLVFGLTSCSSPVETPKGNLSGEVQLEGETDHSDITIALYDLATLDPDIVSINQEYPQIGVHINQHTEFDHRLQSPVKTTETLTDGSFEITKISTGTYNLVAMKAGFGFKYLYEITITEGDNELSELTPQPPLLSTIEGKMKDALTPSLSPRGRWDVPLEKGEQKGVYSSRNNPVISTNMEKSNSKPISSIILPATSKLYEDGTNLSLSSFKEGSQLENRSSNLILFPEVHISGNIEGNIVVAPDHHLVIDDDTVFVPNTSSLTINPGAVLRINPGIDFIIHGTLKAQGEENNMFWVTSNDGFDEELAQNVSIQYYNSMELSSIASIQDDLIEWGKWDWGNTCLTNRQNGAFSNLYIRYGNIGFYNIETINLNVCQSNFVYCFDEIDGGLFIENSSDFLVTKNICLKSSKGIKVKTNCIGVIEDNFLSQNNTNLDITFSSHPQIKNNYLGEAYEWAILIKNDCDPIITYNIISSPYGIYNRHQRNFSTESNPIINFNNFDCTELCLKTTGTEHSPQTTPIDAINNFWGVGDFEIICELIWDKNDEIENYDYTNEVLFEPYSINLIEGCGIKLNNRR